MVEEAEVRERFEAAGQGHVFQYFGELSAPEKEAFLNELDGINVESTASLLEAAKATSLATAKPSDAGEASANSGIRPFSKHVGRTSVKEDREPSYQLGIEATSRGEVAALVLAGGQGTRLGFSGPKGLYSIDLPSKRTLFQVISERLLKLRQLAAKDSSHLPSVPFYIMTSPLNHDETVGFFEKNSFFGLPKEDVCFFRQGMLPCLTEEGKIILEGSGKVSMAPDGNGGIYPSLVKTGMLADMEQRNIKYLHVFSIDNALTKPADPTFIGYCISQGADCGNKVVWKTSAHEKVGVIAEKDGKSCVVEYSDISTEMAEAVDNNGRLRFGAGNICNHFYTIDFLKTEILPQLGNIYHIARKKIPYYDPETKTTVTPTANNGLKLETFIFDVFPLSKSMAVLDVNRSEEFAPVKNAPGSPSDSPDTARAYISELAKKWVQDAGGKLVGDMEAICEVAPLTSYGGEGLEDKVKSKEITCPFSL
ncbi:unnamed protein product [Cylindrotheca closterium]|uniref:UDP-N-acetylglucosamine diphosphorylase n=1 Tax=Cylindrotheca closterium TaxID=2856 RepID=A0AAD2FSV9_9STRA|nr:unnamed protein product [Cylindrotheca closterium]